MGLFSHKIALGELFKGFTDCHCHILPGVDDGFKTMEQSIEALSRYQALGVKCVWLTPHVMEDVPNEPEALQQRFEEICAAAQAAGIGLELHLAAENMMDVLFEDRLAEGKVLAHGEDCLLVETSYFTAPYDLYGILGRVKSAGYFPILAHPERYIYMDMDDYRKLKAMDVRFQLNISSLAGLYGKTAAAKAAKLLKEGYYSYLGTDLHRLSMLDALLDSKIDKKLFYLLPR